MPHNTSKKDNSISSVLGTFFLLALVVVSSAIVAFAVVSNIGSSSEMGPIVTLEVSADGESIYNAGGEELELNKLFVYGSGKLDPIDYKIFSGSNEIFDSAGDLNSGKTTWKTGERLTSSNDVSEICIVYFDGGKGNALYTGSSYVGVVPSVKPTTIKPPTQTPVVPGGKITITLIVLDENGNELDRYVINNIDSGGNLYKEIKNTFTEGKLNLIYDNKMVNGWFKDKECEQNWNFLADKASGSITLYAELLNNPYFGDGTKDSGSYNIAEFVNAVNKWKKGTIVIDNYGNYIICKDIPLKDKSLTFSFNAKFGVWENMITTPKDYGYPSETNPVIWASPYWSVEDAPPLINIQSGSIQFIAGDSGNHISGKAVVEGYSRMSDSVINVESGGTLKVDGSLTVLNGKSGDNTKSTDFGAGIYNAGTITGNISVKNCIATNGGGIYNTGSLTLNGGEISNNKASGGSGGGIYIGGGTVEFKGTNNHVYSNTADSNGGGIYINSGCYLTINNGAELTVGKDGNDYSNTAASDGGGIYNLGTIDVNSGGNLIVIKNKADEGGGIYNNNNNNNNNYGKINVNAVGLLEITKNYAISTVTSGGGIYNKGTITVIDNTAILKVINNKANGNGGGIYNTNKITLYIANVSYNYANNGGGIYIGGGTVEFKGTNNHVYGNTADSNGGGIYINSGCYLTINNGAELTVGKDGNDYSNTAASDGGGIYNLGTVTVNNGGKLNVIKNKADRNGGGIYNANTIKNIGNTKSDGPYNINIVISYNEASQNGGGIYNKGTINNGCKYNWWKKMWETETYPYMEISNNIASNVGGIYSENQDIHSWSKNNNIKGIYGSKNTAPQFNYNNIEGVKFS